MRFRKDSADQPLFQQMNSLLRINKPRVQTRGGDVATGQCPLLHRSRYIPSDNLTPRTRAREPDIGSILYNRNRAEK